MEPSVEKDKSSVSIIKVSSYTALALIAFFMLMKVFGMNKTVWLRFVNVVIVLSGVTFLLLKKRAANKGKLEYLKGMMSAFFTAFLSSLLFSVFIFLYLTLDTTFMNYLSTSQPFGSYLTPASCALVTMVEGVSSGAIVSFLLMHILNRDSENG